MYSGAHRRDDRLADRRRRHRDQAGARAQRADRRQVRGAGLAARAGDEQHAAVVALVGVGRARRDQLAHRARVSSSTRGPSSSSMTSPGMPMSAITMSPARVSAGGSTSDSFGAASVTVMPASIDGADRLVRVGRQAGRQIDGDDRNAGRVDVGDDGLEKPESGALRPVPKIASTISVQSATSEKCSSQAWLVGDLDDRAAPSRPRISRLMRASPRTSATRPMQEHRDVDTALQQRPRDDEAVAAVVAAAAQHGHAGARAGRRGRLRWPRPPGGRRFPSAPATECRSLRSCGDRPRASVRSSSIAHLASKVRRSSVRDFVSMVHPATGDRLEWITA